MLSISRIQLKNYRNLRDIDIELKPLNILIGVNGAGKSNFLKFFHLLHKGADEELSNEISRLGGFQEIRWRDEEQQAETIDWALTFDGLTLQQPYNSEEPMRYRGIFQPQGNTGFEIKHEEIGQPTVPDDESEYSYVLYLQSTSGLPRLLRTASGKAETPELVHDTVYKSNELLIAQLRDRSRYPLFDELRRLFAGWQVYRGFGQDALKYIHEAQLLQTVNPLYLNPQGRNLISVLHTLQNDAQYDNTYEQLTDILTSAFPDFKKLDIRPAAAGKVELWWRTRNNLSFPAFSLSDGMLRFLGLATLLLLPDPPSLILIDEPEIGLHPGLIPMLSGLLKLASEKTQVIVTTHSPLLLNQEIGLEDIILVERDDDGAAIMKRADSLVNLKRWLERFSLGELWNMGKLKG